MEKPGKRLGSMVFVGILLFALGGSALAQEKFPKRPVSLVIFGAPGGGGTVEFHALQPHLERALQGTVQLIYKSGGGGTICFNYVANSAPDGYTVGVVNPSYIVTRYTTKNGVTDDRYEPIALTVMIPAGVVVRADSPWKTFKEFIEYAKANPGKMQMANSGHAAMFHIGIVGIEMAMGVKFTHVPFKGTGPCITALLGGHVDGSLNELTALFPYVEGKKLRILAVSSPSRNPVFPDVPSFKEYGFDLDVGTWYGWVVAKGTSKERIKTLHDAFKAAADSEQYKAFYKRTGGIVEYMGPEGLAAFLKKQDKLWKNIIDYAKFKPVE